MSRIRALQNSMLLVVASLAVATPAHAETGGSDTAVSSCVIESVGVLGPAAPAEVEDVETWERDSGLSLGLRM